MRLKSLLSVSLLSSVATQLLAQQTEKQNIVVIVADDLGTNELGCYGGKNLKTPNIDKLASEGVRFTNFYASCAMSVPVRASLYTGLYPMRHGSYQNHKPTYSDVKSSSYYFQELGYRIGRTGKDHPVNQPSIYNFDKIDGFTVSCTASKPPLSTTTGIENYIRKDEKAPFCLYVCSINSHMPWDAGDASKFNPDSVKLPPNTVDTRRTREEFCNYLAEIQLLDDEVGKVMKTLKETGKLDNTLVFFLGEQGPQLPYGKWTCYHYGQNSALIARYPKKIAAHTTSDAIAQYEDILPTMIDFTGAAPIKGIDGISFLDVLYGKKKDHRNWAYGIHNNIPEGTAYPIRSIQDKRYKLIWNLTPEADYFEKHMMNPNSKTSVWTSWMEAAKVNKNASVLVTNFVKRPAFELYDLQQDPWELNNIANLPEHKERIARMKSEIENWMKQQGDKGASVDVERQNIETANQKPTAISTYSDLSKLIQNHMDGIFYLTNDIVIPNGVEWIPIGATNATDNNPANFTGILDGKGYAIKNINIASSTNFKGLFGRLYHAQVKNLSLEVNIKGGKSVGGVAGSIIGETTIERVSVSGIIQGADEVGGITGRISFDSNYPGYNVITNCLVNADVKATRNNAGGIAGFVRRDNEGFYAKTEISNVCVTGNISSSQGNAAGLLALTEHQYIKLRNNAVLCNSIEGETPNFLYSRNVNTPSFEVNENNIVKKGIKLVSLNHKGQGNLAKMDFGSKVVKYSLLQKSDFYVNKLHWDFAKIWTMGNNKLPVLQRK